MFRKPRSLPAAIVCIVLLLAWQAAAGERPILRLYTWSEYFSKKVVADFEDKYGCTVAIDLFDSNEAMLEDILDGEVAYDIITPSAYMTAEMRRRGMLAPIDHARLSNLGRVDREFTCLTEDPDMQFSVPYTRTVTGVGYNAKLVGPLGDGDRSWRLFSRPELADRVTLLDDMRETLGAALKYLGHSVNTTDAAQIGEAGRLLGLWLDNRARLEVDLATIGLGSGRYAAVHGYNGDIALIMEEIPDIGFFVPGEGSIITSDDFVIPGDAARPDLAHAFIDHVLEPENAAVNMAETLYYMPIPDALLLLDASVLDNHAFSVPPDVLAKCEVIRDLGADNAKYVAVWETLTKNR